MKFKHLKDQGVPKALEIWNQYQTTKDEVIFQEEVTKFVSSFKLPSDNEGNDIKPVSAATIHAEVSKLKESITIPKDDADVDKLLEGYFFLCAVVFDLKY